MKNKSAFTLPLPLTPGPISQRSLFLTARNFFICCFHIASDCIHLLKEKIGFRKAPEASNLLKDNEHCIKELSAFQDPDKIKISIKKTPQRKSRWPCN